MTEGECARILRRMRRRDGQTRCPDCDGARHWVARGKGQINLYTCKKCRRKFSDLTGTIFERTRTPLRKWFKAIDMFLHLDINAKKLMLAIEVTYKTAWSMLNKLRSVMIDDLRRIVATHLYSM
ncbi:MAG TPA: transposase [bacterium]|jgi:transposase-like protein